jgi:beta-phosphoglucomutase-like phosphatase (HAD superfamily)
VLVSASYRALLDVAVRQLPWGSFAAIIAGDEVRNGKPHPEPYLAGAAAVGADPRRCIVIEDSATGAESGNTAGALVLAVRHQIDIPAAPERVQLSTLDGLDLDGLGRLYTLARGYVPVSGG